MNLYKNQNFLVTSIIYAGLGKTIQILALVMATLNELRDQKHHMTESYQHSTLVIVPPALASQWLAEIQKVTGDVLVVDFLDHREEVLIRQKSSIPRRKITKNRLSAADIVITTYQALDKVGKNRAVQRFLAETIWGRIVLDEMQEIRSWSTNISKYCQRLKSDRRWMLSGTPLLEGIKDFRGELCFLGLEPFSALNEDGFFDFAVMNHWEARSQYSLDILRILGIVMLRRSKSMTICKTGSPLLGLKPFNLIFEPVPQDASERGLYCFVEFLMHTMMKKSTDFTEESTNDISNQHHQRSKAAFLRLLRELCVSPHLLNGGFGCMSQLTTLNRWMKDFNRREYCRDAGKHTLLSRSRKIVQGVCSCDEAIRFLSQVEDKVRTDTDYVTSLRLGGGGGVSRRDRALEDPLQLYEVAKHKLERATLAYESAARVRAKARWHRALEGVTTGRVKCILSYERTIHSTRQLWKWRSVLVSCSSLTNANFPPMLVRGWRPTQRFICSKNNRATSFTLERVYKSFPNFRWAHPFALLFSQIPEQVSKTEIKDTLLTCLQNSQGADTVTTPRVFELGVPDSLKTWSAIVHMQNQPDFNIVIKKTNSVEGIRIACTETPSFIAEKITSMKSKLDEAVALNRVHPCYENNNKKIKAKKEYKEAQIGLRINSEERHRPGQVLCKQAMCNIRSILPHRSDILYKSTAETVESATSTLKANQSMIKREQTILNRLESKVIKGIPQHLETLTTFEALQALKRGHIEKTLCPICYDPLGQSQGSDGIISLTRCGHLCCFSCMNDWMKEKEEKSQAISCIECRKKIIRNQLVYIDPQMTNDQEGFDKRQTEAKSLIQQAAEMLDKNNGVLAPHLWEALYLSMDLPDGADCSAHGLLTAIPGHLLGHIRYATGMPVHCTRNQVINSNVKISSKIRALVSDLPREERSVVFASSNIVVQHVLAVLKHFKIGCRALFNGQTEKESEKAISEWHSDDSSLVLVIQAGAAACGLTLTAASKLFLLEPFLKHEEEKQAYARLHRYGQQKEVTCKVYFSPVSVESRLLEWRHNKNSYAHRTEEMTLFAPLRNEVEEDEVEPSEVEKNHFLLGLT